MAMMENTWMPKAHRPIRSQLPDSGLVSVLAAFQ